MNRRHVPLALLAGLTLGVALSAQAEPTYPDKPVRIVVGYSPGGPTDTVARWMAAKLQDSMGQPFVIENKAGAGSNIASELVATSPADGYTLLVAAAPITMNSFVYKSQKFNVEKSFEPISKLSSAPGVLAVRQGLGVNSVAELIELAKKSDGQLTYGSTGLGVSAHGRRVVAAPHGHPPEPRPLQRRQRRDGRPDRGEYRYGVHDRHIGHAQSAGWQDQTTGGGGPCAVEGFAQRADVCRGRYSCNGLGFLEWLFCTRRYTQVGHQEAA